MKKLNLILISAVLTVLSFQTNAMPPKPAQCPSLTSLISGGLPYVDIDDFDNTYYAFQIGQYNTQDLWGFGIGDIQVQSAEEAYSFAKEELSGLNGSPSPVYISADDIWGCFYSTKSGLMAAAITPFNMSFKNKMTKMNRFK